MIIAQRDRFFIWSVVLLLGAVFGFFNVSHAQGKNDLIKVAGSTTLLPIVARAAESFSFKNGRIIVNAGGSGVGIQAVGTGRIDIGLVSRQLTPQEKKRFSQSNLKVRRIGRDGVACALSSEIFHGGVRALSRQQIRDIYLGEITNWKALGGPDREILVIDKERHRGTRHVFMRYVFGDEQAPAPAARLVTGSNNEEQAKIAQSDAAIGMLSIAWLNDDVVGVGLREDGQIIQPTFENIQTGVFPISRDLNLITAGEPTGATKEFIDYLLSPAGQRIVFASGYIPIRPMALDLKTALRVLDD